MSVSLAHDYLTQRGGAERVALHLARLFPKAPLHTSVFNPEGTYPEFEHHQILPSFLQRSRLFREDPRKALPLLAFAWQRTYSGGELVIASSSGWSHGISVSPGTLKVVYCHNPPRWLYQSTDYIRSTAGRALSHPLRSALTVWDKRKARTAEVYLANSTIVARRICETYGIEAQLLHPPTQVDTSGPQDPEPGLEPGYWLTVARGRAYKNTATLIEAVIADPRQRLVIVGTRPAHPVQAKNIVWTGVVSDARLRWLYANARALVSVSNEDFGLTPIEANAYGTPSLLLRAGGFLDTLKEGISGFGIDNPTPQAVLGAMRSFSSLDIDQVKRHAESFSIDNFARKLQRIILDERPSLKTILEQSLSRTICLPTSGPTTGQVPVQRTVIKRPGATSAHS